MSDLGPCFRFWSDSDRDMPDSPEPSPAPVRVLTDAEYEDIIQRWLARKREREAQLKETP